MKGGSDQNQKAGDDAETVVLCYVFISGYSLLGGEMQAFLTKLVLCLHAAAVHSECLPWPGQRTQGLNMLCCSCAMLGYQTEPNTQCAYICSALIPDCAPYLAWIQAIQREVGVHKVLYGGPASLPAHAAHPFVSIQAVSKDSSTTQEGERRPGVSAMAACRQLAQLTGCASYNALKEMVFCARDIGEHSCFVGMLLLMAERWVSKTSTSQAQ